MPSKKNHRAEKKNRINSNSASVASFGSNIASETMTAERRPPGRPPKSRMHESAATRNLFPVDSEVCAWFKSRKVAWLGYVTKLGVDQRTVKLYDFPKPKIILVENLYSSAESLAKAKNLPVNKVLVGLNSSGIKHREQYLDRIRNLAIQEQQKDEQRRLNGESTLPTLPEVRLERIPTIPHFITPSSMVDERLSSDSDESENEEVEENDEQAENTDQEGENLAVLDESNLNNPDVSVEEVEARNLQQKRSKLFAINGVKNMVCNMIDAVASDISKNSSVSDGRDNPVCVRFLLDALIDKLKREKVRDNGASMVDDAGWLSTFWATKELVEKANREFGGIVGNEASEKSGTPAVEWICGICVPTPNNDLVFPYRRKWFTHAQEHLLAYSRFACPISNCPHSQAERYRLTRHVMGHHGYTEGDAKLKVSAAVSHESRAIDVVPLTPEESENIKKSIEKQQKKFRLEARRRRLEREEALLDAQSSEDQSAVLSGRGNGYRRQRRRVERSGSSTESSWEREVRNGSAGVGARAARGAGRQQRPRRGG